MKRLPDLTGQTFGYLFLKERRTPGHRYLCRCKCGKYKIIGASSIYNGHTRSCGCYNKERLKEVHTGKAYTKGKKPANWVDRTGTRHKKLLFLEYLGGSLWRCLCDCGNETKMSILNIARTSGCRHCAHRKDIAGTKIGLLTAVALEEEIVKGRPPLWTFSCDCGGSIQGKVVEFNGLDLRSCGCHDNVHGSWGSMMSRCYNEKDSRYSNYGGRGVKVCERWHDFANFLADMGERPKRYNLSRKRCEEDYSPDNCEWEHISLNNADTCNGIPTKAGLLKGAKPRAKRA